MVQLEREEKREFMTKLKEKREWVRGYVEAIQMWITDLQNQLDKYALELRKRYPKIRVNVTIRVDSDRYWSFTHPILMNGLIDLRDLQDVSVRTGREGTAVLVLSIERVYVGENEILQIEFKGSESNTIFVINFERFLQFLEAGEYK